MIGVSPLCAYRAPSPAGTDPARHWYAPPVTIKVLCYSDDSDVDLSRESPYGIGIMRDLATSVTPFFANVEFAVLNRHGGPVVTKLTPNLLAEVDQLWILGFRSGNLPGHEDNELSGSEVTALAEWMRTGGVLITGDHANPEAGGESPLPVLLGMGRALGRHIPRAGELRRWQGPPDVSEEGRFDTQEPPGRGRTHDLTMQSDGLLQALLLRRFPAGQTVSPGAGPRRPHPLFLGRHGEITLFPDHQHEGALDFPEKLDPDHWPSGPYGQPRPYPIASGMDKRTGEVRPLVSAYDGSTAGVGRIVADTSWHHYININLCGLTPGSAIDSMADYYLNLALWLAPKRTRDNMARCMLWWLAHHPSVRMTLRHPVEDVGRTSLSALRVECGHLDTYSILSPLAIDASLRTNMQHVPEELVVGSMVLALKEFLDSARSGTAPAEDDAIAAGLRRALTLYANRLSAAEQAVVKLRDLVEHA